MVVIYKTFTDAALPYLYDFNIYYRQNALVLLKVKRSL